MVATGDEWRKASVLWEIARGLPHNFERLPGEVIIIYNLTCCAVKGENIYTQECSKVINQLVDRIFSCYGINDTVKNHTVLSKLCYLLTKQFDELFALEEVLPLLWKIIVNYIVLLLSTGYGEADAVELLQLFNKCQDQLVRSTGLTLYCMVQSNGESIANSELLDTLLYYKGTQLFYNSEWEAAIATIEPCIVSSNLLVSSATSLLIGCCHAKQGRYQLALCSIQKVMKDDDRLLVYALHNLVQVFISSSAPEGEMEASKLLYQALSCKEELSRPQICHWNAFCLPTDQASHQAVDHKALLHVCSNSVPLPHLLGDLAIQTYHYACRACRFRKFDVAVELFTALVDNIPLSLDSEYLPTPTQLTVELCHTLVCAGHYNEAIFRCDTLLQLLEQSNSCCREYIFNKLPSNETQLLQATLFLYKGEALQEMGDCRKAMQHYRSGLQKLEKSDGEVVRSVAIQLLNNLSLILIGFNKNAEATSLLTEAIERDPSSKGCNYNLTLLLWKMGHVSKAVEGWAWYRDLPIKSHSQCQITLEKLINRQLLCCDKSENVLEQQCHLLDKAVLLYTIGHLL